MERESELSSQIQKWSAHHNISSDLHKLPNPNIHKVNIYIYYKVHIYKVHIHLYLDQKHNNSDR